MRLDAPASLLTLASSACALLSFASMAASATSSALPVTRVSHSSGAALELVTFGAHITSFTTASGQSVLFLSSKACLDGSKAIRGGIPIAFPQFAAQGPLPMHGFARTATWTLDATGDGSAQLSLSDSDATRAIWPHRFRLVYSIAFDNEHLSTTLRVFNTHLAGTASGVLEARIDPAVQATPAVEEAATAGSFSFEALLHTYLHVGVGNAGSVAIRGLRGVAYLEKPSGGAEVVEGNDAIALAGEVDRIYQNTPASVIVEGIKSGAKLADAFRSVKVLRSAGHTQAPQAPPGGSGGHESPQPVPTPLDVVVWNPGAARAATIADLGEGEWQDYVCVEPGRVSAATAAAHPCNRLLRPGESWFIQQTIRLRR